jgi:hypothetical protein
MCYHLQVPHGKTLFNILQLIALVHEYPKLFGTSAAGKDVSCLLFCYMNANVKTSLFLFIKYERCQ